MTSLRAAACIPAACIIVLAALLGSPASGQVAPAPAMTRSASAMAMSRVERHVAELRSRMAITPAQQPLWETFASIMRENAQRLEEDHNAHLPRPPSSTAVDDMRAYAATTRLRADGLERLMPAFEALYATMSPDQRAKADKTFQQFRRGSDRRGPG